ncbi:DUF4129 domain-containing protein [Cellulomonas timonensis]|uniref:DUF4129 domain-containing protein n=1 Tax=Cellulomonas timonensis TaxID=1689271 RepID=UPI00083401ED|nr:DUF4129 domain-containing protein [Cellulomonas timonensis]
MTFVFHGPRLSDVPVQPGADDARALLEQELADPVYHRGPSLLQRILDWLAGLFGDAPQLALPPRAAVLIVVAVLVVVAAVALWIAGPVRRARHGSAHRAVLADDEGRSAAELRAAADAAAAQGVWDAAVADRFRAVVRALEERALLDERPGRTAHEVVAVAVRRLPARAEDLQAAGRLFDDVVYGGVRAREQDDVWLRAVDARVAAERPLDAASAAPEPTGWSL